MKYGLMMGFSLALMAGVATQVMAQDDDVMSDDSAAARPLDTTASEAILRNSTTSANGNAQVVNSVEAVSSTTQMPNGNTIQQTTTTVKQVIVSDTNVVAQPETVAQTTATEPFNVIMPDGTKLQITEQEWWKDARLNGYTRFWFDSVANAYRPVVEKDNSTYQKRENTWCTPEQSAAGKC